MLKYSLADLSAFISPVVGDGADAFEFVLGVVVGVSDELSEEFVVELEVLLLVYFF